MVMYILEYIVIQKNDIDNTTTNINESNGGLGVNANARRLIFLVIKIRQEGGV